MSNAIESQGTKFQRVITTGGNISVTYASAGKTITRTVGSFIDDGFEVGHVVDTTSGTNPGPFTVNTRTATVLTVDESVTDEGPVDNTITADVDVAEIISFTGPGGAASVIDDTHLASTAREKRMGLPDEGQISLEMNLVPDNSQHLGLKDDRNNRTKRAFKIILTDTGNMELSFSGYVLNFSIAGAVDDVVKASIVIEIDGAVTWTP
jgi:predicted secreted protein